MLDQAIETVSNELGQLNSGNQQSMIELQSLAGQRSQTTMMGTQLLSHLHQTMSAVVNNVGK